MKQRFYTAPDGTKYPVSEAQYPMSFTIYRSCQGKAVIGDPGMCVIAQSIRKNPDVLDVYVGSGGHAYVIFKAKRGNPAMAVHFVIRTAAAKVRDAFDTNKKIKTQVLMLHVPTPNRTLEGMSERAAKRNAAIKNGAVVTKRGSISKTRFVRLGVSHRPRPIVRKDNIYTATSLTPPPY